MLSVSARRAFPRFKAFLSRPLSPARGLTHPLFWSAVALLAVNDHFLKGSGSLPSAVTGKLSDLAGLVCAPVVVGLALRARTTRGWMAALLITGVCFAAIKTSAFASDAFTHALGVLGVPWINRVDRTDLVALPMLVVAYCTFTPIMRSNMLRSRFRRRLELASVFAAVPVMLASGGGMGGANLDMRAPGNGDKGVDVSAGNIAVSPSGKYFVHSSTDRLVIGDLSTKTLRSVPELGAPAIVAFWSAAQGNGFFVVSRPSVTSEDLVSYDMDAQRIVFRKSLDRRDTGIIVEDTGSRVVLFSSYDVDVRDASTGEWVGDVTPRDGVRDVDVSSDGQTLIVTGRTTGAATSALSTTLYVRNLADTLAKCEVTIPNCADELVIAKGTDRAFLAPTSCQRDPVSIINVATCQLEKTLPGFGPVALSQNGLTAIAFADRDTTDPLAPPLPPDVVNSDSRYHLMFIDVAALTFGTTPVGADLPRYAVTPDGRLLLIDTAYDRERVRILDIDARTLRDVQGPAVRLDNFVLMPDARFVYGIDQTLSPSFFRIDTSSAVSELISLAYEPIAINMVPSGETLLLKDNAAKIHLYDVATAREVGAIYDSALLE